MVQNRENGQKPQLGQFLTISRLNISKLQIFLKNRFHSKWRPYLVLTRVRQLAYVAYVRTPTFNDVRMILDMGTLKLTLIFSLWLFKVFKIFLNLIILQFKNLMLYIGPLTFLLVLGRDRFFTVYIYFKETYFPIFHTNYLINISPYLEHLPT